LTRVAFSISALSGYVALVGYQPSVLRAAAMTSVILILSASGRGVKPLVAVAHAASFLLIVSPYLSLSVGFLLSFAATAGILVLTPWIYSKLKSRLPLWLAATLSVSLGAQIWCAPFLLQFQGGLPTYSLLANLLVEPIVAPITVLGVVACVLSFFAPSLTAPITWLASVLASYVVWVAHALSALPFSTIWWPAGQVGFGLLIMLAVATTLLALRRYKPVAVALVTVATSFLLVSGGIATARQLAWPQPDWQVANCDVGQGDALLIKSQGQIALVDVGRDIQPIDECLKRLSIRKIDLLVLTHFDADHVGGLAGALSGRTVEVGMLTDFHDDRPQAQAIAEQLTGSAGKVIRAKAGMAGNLGRISWLVLQPEAGGFDAEDSNDGSIAMRWDAPDFTLFTMADLGEKGQMRMTSLHMTWISPDPNKPLILKVSHHGSADQYAELIEWWKPDVAIISVGKENPYGHPTRRTLSLLAKVGARVLRTDEMGAFDIAKGEACNCLTVATDG
jgi:competence protein ComEC